MFGEAFFILAEKCSQNDTIFVDAIIPTLEVIANAPRRSEPYFDKIVKVLSSITILSLKGQSPLFIHLKICNFIAETLPENSINLFYKFLMALNLKSDFSSLKEFSTELNRIIAGVKDTNIVRKLIKFKLKVTSYIYESDVVSISSCSGSLQTEDEDNGRLEESSGYSSEQSKFCRKYYYIVKICYLYNNCLDYNILRLNDYG